MELRDLGEFGLIDIIKQHTATITPTGFEGIGDDCAVIPIDKNNSYVVTTDLLIDGIHFTRETVIPLLLGRKSLSVNISDIAAMGATPVASFLGLSLPPNISVKWVNEFIEGYKAVSDEFAVPLLGGDTTSSTDKIAISVTAIGRIANNNIKRRSGAQVDDIIFVTGLLGESAQGLKDIQNKIPDSHFTETHHNPKAYVKEGEWLGRRIDVTSMMDISDGVASDLMHILRASGVGATVEVCNLPTRVDKKTALCGGEDYLLLFTANCNSADNLMDSYFKQFKTPIYPIGRIIGSTPRIDWVENGDPITPDWHGFTHF